jgi:hypothetical protein|tara:strand:+ start:640 stop:933 length:294 start_codon:yes stop_codon:yes gene_type:complete
MNRYKNNKRRIDKNGVRVFTSTYYPEIPLNNSDTLYQTTVNDRLDNLAFSFYEDSSLWWIIAKANGIKGKTVLDPGIMIRIPGNVSKVIEDFKKLNS